MEPIPQLQGKTVINNWFKNLFLIGIYFLLSQQIYTSFYYTHERSPLKNPTNSQKIQPPNLREFLLVDWTPLSFSLSTYNQPLDDIREYFGEKLALFFAFCDFSRVWIFWFAVIGLGVFAYGIWNSSE